MVMSSHVQQNKKLDKLGEVSLPVISGNKRFELKANNTFARRASGVFQGLNSLEHEHSTWMVKNEVEQSFERILEAKDVSVDNIPTTSKTEIFKMPCMPVRRSKKDSFIRKNKNTRVWRKYSLKDIPLTSDTQNAAVAFQFLNELRKKKEESNYNETVPHDGKISFRKPSKRNLVQSPTSCNEVTSDSTTEKEKLSKNSNIKLDHLRDEFEDE